MTKEQRINSTNRRKASNMISFFKYWKLLKNDISELIKQLFLEYNISGDLKTFKHELIKELYELGTIKEVYPDYDEYYKIFSKWNKNLVGCLRNGLYTDDDKYVNRNTYIYTELIPPTIG